MQTMFEIIHHYLHYKLTNVPTFLLTWIKSYGVLFDLESCCTLNVHTYLAQIFERSFRKYSKTTLLDLPSLCDKPDSENLGYHNFYY